MAEPEVHPLYRITDWEPTDRPRERLQAHGPAALTSAELLAILLRTGVPGENAVQVGQRLLVRFKGLAGLHRAPFDDLKNQRGVGAAKTAQIKAAIELGRRLALETPEDRPGISSPADAAALVQHDMSALEQEHFRVLLLDTKNRVLDAPVEVYRGSINMAQVRVGEVFKVAVRRNAAAIILVHNHPSGDPTPSPDDVAVTRAVVEAGKLLDVDVLDHLIIGHTGWVSMKERGLGFA
jgi:DNA repair protein RadC